MSFIKTFILAGDAGQELGTIALEQLWANTYGIKIKKTGDDFPVEACSQAIQSALLEARTRHAQRVLLRLIKTANWQELSKRLPTMGFRKKHDRVEFKKPVDQLPTDSGSPVSWKTARELKWSTRDIAGFITLVAQGDPDHDPNEDPMDFIQDFLSDSVLTSGLDCIHVGMLGDKKAALAVVQLNPKTGWSRISYMGVAPEFRGQGLGKWVHRHSFKVMKERGGKLYHGGTGATNQPMIRLFESHGCERFVEMEEWAFEETSK